MTIISSKDNPVFKETEKLIKSSKMRKKTGLFTAEGFRIVNDAVLSGCKIKYFIFSESACDKYNEFFSQCRNNGEKMYVFSDSLYSKISDTFTPQGMLACISRLDKNCLFDKIKLGGKYIALENIQDPGNMGTVFRTAEALGIDGIVLSKDCCDVYSPKVVRGTMGAVFRMPFSVVDDLGDFISGNRQLDSYAAVVTPDCEKAGSVKFSPNCITVIGNEGNGLTESTISACGRKITIPMGGRAESLNASVAAGILIWEMMRE